MTQPAAASRPLLTPIPGKPDSYVWQGVAPSVAACWQIVVREPAR